MIRIIASEQHYRHHLEPIAKALGANIDDGRQQPAERPRITIVASWKDYQRSKGPVAFLEHGSGIAYQGRHHSYAGGPGRDRVVLFANTNQFVQERNAASYPHAEHAIVGSPRLDTILRIARPQHATPTVAFGWHWDCKVNPETRTALPHYAPHLPRIAGQARWEPTGHGHPRAWDQLQKRYARWGWDHTPNFAQIVANAAVYVCDNSSTIYEWAALDRPAIILNAPWYRRDVHHGPLRFWERIPGIQVDEPENLAAAIDQALTNDTWSARRQEITAEVYPHVGNATQRAVDAILSVLV